MKRNAASKLSPVERTLAAPLPLGRDGDRLDIVFGSNPEVRKVLMQFNVATGCLIFDPADARAVAKQLAHYADMADGKKAM
jgi:hypothetical protein